MLCEVTVSATNTENLLPHSLTDSTDLRHLCNIYLGLGHTTIALLLPVDQFPT